MKKPQSLAYRLIQAVGAVGELEKKGKNQTADYAWLRASDVARAFRKELKRRHILITTDEKEAAGRTVQTLGGPMTMITVKVDFYFHCGLTGEVIGPRCGIGQAMDAGDKGLYKAKTGALKSFLRLVSLLPDKDDPEADETVDQTTKPKVPKVEASRPSSTYRERHAATPVNLHQIKAFEDAIRATGKTEAEYQQYLRMRFEVESHRQLNRGQFAEAIKWALTVPEARKPNGTAQPIVEILDHVPTDEVAGD